MKSSRKLDKKTHIGWRPDPALRERWLAFLKTQPPINRTEFLNAALTLYLDQVDRYGLDPLTLRPKVPRKRS
jgi:hypothetical protein